MSAFPSSTPSRPTSTEAVAALNRLAALPGVDDAIRAAREACTQLRWHPALRRRSVQARAEASIRAARCSAALEGARYPVPLIRDVARGAAELPDDASGRLALGALRVLSQAAQCEETIGTAPAQALAGLHVAAAAGLLPESELGRPRRGFELPGDGVGEPASAPMGSALSARLAGMAQLLAAPAGAPALVVAALIHAELITARPFLVGNGLVARAAARAVMVGRGLDPVGVVVWEAAELDAGREYQQALLEYGTGRPDGVARWLIHCAGAVVTGAVEGQNICDAVLAGRLTGSPAG